MSEIEELIQAVKELSERVRNLQPANANKSTKHRIIDLFNDQEEITIEEIVVKLDAHKQTIYQALKTLEKKGIVKSKGKKPLIWSMADSDTYDKKLAVARKLGYCSVSEAISDMGSYNFNQECKKRIR